MNNKKLTYSSILKSIATLKNSGTLYEFKKGSAGEHDCKGWRAVKVEVK